jgi:branched-chain amino acid transport system permease protein
MQTASGKGRGRPLAWIGLGVVVVVGLALFTEVPVGATIVLGTVEGSVIALVAVGLAVVYKSTGVLNFAQGELGTLPAFVVLLVMLRGNLDGDLQSGAIGVPAMFGYLVLAVIVGVVLGLLVNGLVMQRLVDAPPVTSLVATGTVFFLLVGVEFFVFQPRLRPFPRVMEGFPCVERDGAGACVRELTILGTPMLWHAIVVIAVLLVVAVALALFFRTTRGIALLASAQEPFAAELYGVSPKAMSRLAWGIAGGLGGLAGFLFAGVFQRIFPAMVTRDLLVLAFTGAVLGGVSSMVGAVVGSLLLGILAVLANETALAYGITGAIPNPPMAVAFAVLLAVMFFRPRGLLGKEA